MKKRTWKIALMLSLFIAVFAACDDDDEYYYVGGGSSWISYGNLEKIDNGTRSKYAIRRDDGSRLIVTEGYGINSSDAEEGLRVFANYSILGSERDGTGLEGRMNYYIRLYRITDVLTKDPVKLSFIKENEEVRQDSIGNDPINVSEAWFGGKYLNVEFRIPVKSGSSTKHFINLVEDDVVAHNDTVYVTLRHNAYGEAPKDGDRANHVWSRGMVSFDLTSIVPEGKQSVPVKLLWTEYKNGSIETVTREDSGTYTLSGSNEEEADSGLNQSNNERKLVSSEDVVGEVN
ncbi:NigD-like C-terminal domain-containing protein [Butyricimonas sp. Marseille-P3923]|uniref:NigD1/NigD2 family lipoprotein n=1 Tax=Butyricimonas sp. Marseille-P3923 TaxID=1987504 RepID=UPI00159B92E7|nr:NigD-like C-terminal domain-containing protein [Butyricimonas sp. Marseille-P3923]